MFVIQSMGDNSDYSCSIGHAPVEILMCSSDIEDITLKMVNLHDIICVSYAIEGRT